MFIPTLTGWGLSYGRFPPHYRFDPNGRSVTAPISFRLPRSCTPTPRTGVFLAPFGIRIELRVGAITRLRLISMWARLIRLGPRRCGAISRRCFHLWSATTQTRLGHRQKHVGISHAIGNMIDHHSHRAGRKYRQRCVRLRTGRGNKDFPPRASLVATAELRLSVHHHLRRVHGLQAERAAVILLP